MQKVLFSDFDNTLYVEDYAVVKKNILAIDKFIRDSVFVIITGRAYKSIKRVLDEYNIRYDYLICKNGAEIYSKDKLLLKKNLKKEDIEVIKEIIAKYNVGYSVDDFDDERFIGDDVSSIFIKRDYRLNSDCIREIREKTTTYNYLSPHWFNIVAENVNKALAVEDLKKIIGEEVKIYTIGDAINDKEMIKNYNGAKMKVHESYLDDLDVPAYEYFYQYVEQILKED